MKPKCPKCGREATYSKKYDQCSACGRGYAPVTTTSTSPVPAEDALGGRWVELPPQPDEPVVMGRASLPLEPGKPCPTCGKPVGKTSAQLQREYRGRKKGKLSHG